MNPIEQAIEALERIATSFNAGTCPEQYLMDEAAKAVATLKAHQQAAQDVELPPLPEPDERTRKGLAFSGFAMESYALAALKAHQARQAVPQGWRDTVRAALHLLNDTQKALGGFVANHRNPSEKAAVSELLGLHDTNAALRTRRELSELLATQPTQADALLPAHHAHTLQRAISILRDLSNKTCTPTDPYGGLSYGEDADDLDELLSRMLAAPQPEAHQARQVVPQVCDGQEQEAFVAWAFAARYDMQQHPLHWLFLNEKTDAARQGWKGALEYVGRELAASPQPAQCPTCNDNGLVGGPSFYAPDEGGAPCPDCAAQPTQPGSRGQRLRDAGHTPRPSWRALPPDDDEPTHAEAPSDTLRVACVSLGGTTLTVPAEQLEALGIGDEGGDTYALIFKTMTRAEFDALGEFDGF